MLNLFTELTKSSVGSQPMRRQIVTTTFNIKCFNQLVASMEDLKLHTNYQLKMQLWQRQYNKQSVILKILIGLLIIRSRFNMRSTDQTNNPSPPPPSPPTPLSFRCYHLNFALTKKGQKDRNYELSKHLNNKLLYGFNEQQTQRFMTVKL